MATVFCPWRSSCGEGLLIVPESAPLNEDRGADSGTFSVRARARDRHHPGQATCYSVISSVVGVDRWIPVHLFARGRTKLLGESPAPTRGMTVASPFESVDTVLDVVSLLSTVSHSVKRLPIPFQPCACDAIAVRPGAA